MASKANSVKIHKIDTEKPSYNKAASGDNGIEALVRNSVSYTKSLDALYIYRRLIEDYEFDSSSYENWVASVEKFVSDLSVAIRDGYDNLTGTGETPDLSLLKNKMLATLSPGFKDQTPQNRKSKYEDVTIRSVMNYYKPSGDTQEQMSTIKASELVLGISNVYSAKDTVIVPVEAEKTVSSRASEAGMNVSMSTSPEKYVCIADEIYDASGAVDEESTRALASMRNEYDGNQTSMEKLYTPYMEEPKNEEADEGVSNVISSNFVCSSGSLSDETLVPVSNTQFVSSADIVRAEETSDMKDVKEQMDDALTHDDTVAIDTGNVDNIQGKWVNENNANSYEDGHRTFMTASAAGNAAGHVWKVRWDRDPVRLASYGQISSDPLDNTKNATYYEYGLKIVELPPVGVDMESFGEAFEFRFYSRIENVGTLASNASIEAYVPPAGQNAVGHYYKNHSARSLSFSVTVHQQEYPDTPLTYIANRLQELSRPYQYGDLHVEPKRCQIFLPGMTFEGYISSVSCSFKGDLYTTWNDELPSGDGQSLVNTTGDQYSYGQLDVTMQFMIEEDIALKQVKSDEKYALPVPDLPEAESASTTLNDVLDQISLIGDPDKELVKKCFEAASNFRLRDIQDIRNWIKKLMDMVKSNTDKIDTLDGDVSSVENPNELQKFFIADKNSNGFLSQAILLYNSIDYAYTERSCVDAIKGLVLGMEGGEKNFSDLTLLTDPGFVSVTDSEYTFQKLFKDGNYAKFAEVMPLANDYVDTEDKAAWKTVLKTLPVFAVVTASVVIAPVLAGIALGVAARVLVVSYIIKAISSACDFLGRLLGFQDRDGQFHYEYFIKAIEKLKSDDKVYGFLERVEFMRPYFRKINFTVNSDFMKKALESATVTIAEHMMIGDKGEQRVAYKDDDHVIIYPHLLWITLMHKALGKTMTEAMNNSEFDLSAAAQSSLVAQIKGNNKGYGNSDEIEKIHKELTDGGKDEYLANMVYNYRLMKNALLTVNSMKVDINALDIDNKKELSDQFVELKSDLVRWDKLVSGDHFLFYPGYIAGMYEKDKEDKFKSKSGKAFWKDLTKSEDGFDWIRLKSSRGTYFKLEFKTLTTRDESTGDWGYVPELVAEVGVPGETDDALVNLDFTRYLRCSVTNLRHNGLRGGRFSLDSPVPPSNNPLVDSYSNTFVVNGKEIYNEELSKDNSVDSDNMEHLRAGDFMYAFGLCFSDGWFEQTDRKWIDQYWEEPASDNFWSREFVHNTLNKFNSLMDALSNLTIKKDIKKTDVYATELHDALTSLGFVSSKDDKEVCMSMKSLQEHFYASAENAVNLLTAMGMPTKTVGDVALKKVGIGAEMVVSDAFTPSNPEVASILLSDKYKWGDLFLAMKGVTPNDSTWYTNVNILQGISTDKSIMLTELFNGINASDPINDELFMRIGSWFYTSSDGMPKETDIVASFKKHDFAYPYVGKDPNEENTEKTENP